MPAVDERKAERDAKGLVSEVYQTISRGKTDSLFSLLGDPIIVFGPRRGDATITRSDALVALGKVIDSKAKKHAQLRTSGLEVVASEGGHSAWLFDVVSIDGQPLAVTAVLSNTDDLWSVSAAALAETPTGKQLKVESAKNAIVPPGASALAKIDPAAAMVVEQFKKGLADQQVWGDDLASRTDAVVAGPAAGQVARGKQAIKRLWKARMKSNVREVTSGELAAAITADGQLAWLSVPVTRASDDEDVLPLRIFTVYEKAGTGWKLIALHEALAVDQPGSGTAFKKVVPPAAAPAPAKADPTEANPDDTADAKPKHKKKRKPKPKPDDDAASN